ncbi:FAD-dependent oxidoreductase [Streptomyces erythrochromogenes]|uniref:FAD-dependent oxidoreductase n=1 Tax=Streptomyces erythrochromogenes TaxID=285574 RepID=UPI0036AF0899
MDPFAQYDTNDAYDTYDTVIVGGGPAGLTAALALTRYRCRTLVVESPAPPRNAASRGVHGMIGLEGATPAEVRARAWAELDGYGWRSGARWRPRTSPGPRRAASTSLWATVRPPGRAPCSWPRG